MKIAPADVTYYSSAADMLARYREIHGTFWKMPIREVMPETEIGAARNDVRQTVGATASARPEHAAAAPVELPASFAAMLRHPLSRFERIVAAVCDEFHITRHELLGRRRFAAVVAPRALTFALARHLTGRSMPEIGRRAGGFDHTTVMYAIRKLASVLDTVKDQMPEDATPAEWVRVMREHMGI